MGVRRATSKEKGERGEAGGWSGRQDRAVLGEVDHTVVSSDREGLASVGADKVGFAAVKWLGLGPGLQVQLQCTLRWCFPGDENTKGPAKRTKVQTSGA